MTVGLLERARLFRARFWVDVLPVGVASIYLSEEGDLVYRQSEWGGYEWWNPTARRFIVPLIAMDKIRDFRAFIGEMVESCVGKDFVLCVQRGYSKHGKPDTFGVFRRISLPSVRDCDLRFEDGGLALKELKNFLVTHEVMES